MKKFIIAISAVLYLATVSGATIHLHYCMNKLAGWRLWSQHTTRCGKCGMTKSEKQQTKGCCRDEQIKLKLTGDQKMVEAYQLVHTNFTPAFIPFIELPTELFALSVAEQNPMSHAPPRNVGVALYIRHCIFRIWFSALTTCNIQAPWVVAPQRSYRLFDSLFAFIRWNLSI